ncbi:MAG TPA: sigma-70 family RNA polymerase sigma factor [Motilibacteraceae bacterium]|nr:sigma-70 family RNA polymerase sigma factor [Motilibacteraceae bacterium]
MVSFPRRLRVAGDPDLVVLPGAADGPAQPAAPAQRPLDATLLRVARGDEAAFEELYDAIAGSVFGVVRRVLRDPAQSEEVAQEVLVEVWRSATRFDPERGSAQTWILTMAHRRAVDRVRSAQAASDREERVGAREHTTAYDDVVEQVETRLEVEAVRRCLGGLTELQREAVNLAFYGGYTHREVAELLDTPLGTVKTRLRDGLIRLRDCLGVSGDG